MADNEKVYSIFLPYNCYFSCFYKKLEILLFSKFVTIILLNIKQKKLKKAHLKANNNGECDIHVWFGRFICICCFCCISPTIPPNTKHTTSLAQEASAYASGGEVSEHAHTLWFRDRAHQQISHPSLTDKWYDTPILNTIYIWHKGWCVFCDVWCRCKSQHVYTVHMRK